METARQIRDQKTAGNQRNVIKRLCDVEIYNECIHQVHQISSLFRQNQLRCGYLWSIQQLILIFGKVCRLAIYLSRQMYLTGKGHRFAWINVQADFPLTYIDRFCGAKCETQAAAEYQRYIIYIHIYCKLTFLSNFLSIHMIASMSRLNDHIFWV